MIYADTDFFLALLKPTDWLKQRATRLLEKYSGQIRTSAATMTELLLLAAEYDLDPERLLVDSLGIAHLDGAEPNAFLLAAHYMKEKNVGVFDSLHAAHCGDSEMISSDKVFDRLGLKRIPLEQS